MFSPKTAAREYIKREDPTFRGTSGRKHAATKAVSLTSQLVEVVQRWARLQAVNLQGEVPKLEEEVQVLGGHRFTGPGSACFFKYNMI